MYLCLSNLGNISWTQSNFFIISWIVLLLQRASHGNNQDFYLVEPQKVEYIRIPSRIVGRNGWSQFCFPVSNSMAFVWQLLCFHNTSHSCCTNVSSPPFPLFVKTVNVSINNKARLPKKRVFFFSIVLSLETYITDSYGFAVTFVYLIFVNFCFIGIGKFKKLKINTEPSFSFFF